MSTHVRHVLDLHELAKDILDVLEHAMGFDAAALFLVEPETGDLVRYGQTGPVAADELSRLPAGTGVTGWVARHGRIQNVPDISLDRRSAGTYPGVVSELHCPLIVEGQTIGVLVFGCSRQAAFGLAEERILEAVAGLLANFVWVANLYQKTHEAAAVDHLTGVLSRRQLLESAEQSVLHAAASRQPLTLAMVDMVGLKELNDTFGHAVGDRALHMVATAFQKGLRVDDLVGRLGGDEFCLVLVGSTREHANQRLKPLMKNLGQLSTGTCRLPLRAAYGLASFPDDGRTISELLGVADDRLYAWRRTHLPVSSR